jgi:hypothetical protein
MAAKKSLVLKVFQLLMWKRNLVVAKPTIKFVSVWVVVLGVFALSACSGEATPFVESTQVLIPSTATFTPSPIAPTPTLDAALSAPEDITAIAPAGETPAPDTDNVLNVDPVAAELASLAQRRIAEDLGLPVRRVRVVDVQSYTWTDTSLGCPVAGETYTAIAVDGYRIALAAGENEYIFHTDFDRALPCDAANEQLPESTPES